MLTLNCPSCGAIVEFRSKASVFAVCSYCKATLVRQDMNLTNIGKMADLKYDMTPLQIGCFGNYNGARFELIGRLKVGYSEGFWNEWYALFADERTAWLAEAQGFYALCFAVQAIALPDKDDLQPGMVVDLRKAGFFNVDDIRSVKCLFSEGELPVNAVQGRQSLSVDLIGQDNQMATIEYAHEETRVFAGEYQDFDTFRFSNLRVIDGW